MNIILFVFLNFLFISSLSAEIVYKSVDANGNVSFSDYRIEEAEEIRIKTPQITNAPKAWIPKPILSKDKPNKFNYTNLTIDNPKDDTTIHSGKVNITVTLKPALIENDVIVLFMDGKEVLSGKSLNFSLENVDRGTHKIYVTVKNEVNKVLKRSAEIIFHVRRVVQLSPKLSSDSKLITPLNPPRPSNSIISPINLPNS